VAHPPSNAIHSATPTTSASTAVEKLLRDLGPQLHRAPVAEAPTCLPTGITNLDQLLGGGFPLGRLSEIAGPASSGRTSLALALLAQATRAGESTAVVDASDAFDPASAHSAGALLDRVLWVRAAADSASRSAEQILKAHGFALVLLDLTNPGLRMPPATGPRLARAAASTGTALVIVTRARSMGTAAEIAIELAPVRARFTGTPALLEGLEIRAALVRHRSAPSPRTTTVHLRTPQAAAAKTTVSAA
jgi:RecA/RadA recombinase